MADTLPLLPPPVPGARWGRPPTDPAGARRRHLLGLMYDASTADTLADALTALLARGPHPTPTRPLDETDAWLVAHPDHVADGTGARTPLAALTDLVDAHLSHAVSGVHTLPLHLSSPGDGSAVTDHGQVDPAFGTAADLRRLAAGGTWLAHAVVTLVPARGTRFRGSADQVDLGHRSPQLLLAMVEVLLGHLALGARAIRLDATGVAWTDPAASSPDLPGAHHLVQLLRACLDAADPGLVLIIGATARHEENVAYLGLDGGREAQAVYQLALSPLTLHAFTTGDARPLKQWAAGVWFPGAGQTYLNALAGPDGIGVRAVDGVLPPAEVDRLVEVTLAAGGVVHERTLPDGTRRPDELAVTWADVVGHGCSGDDAMRRHLSSHALALALRGVPLLYLGSLVAATGDTDRYATTGHGRDLTRRRWQAEDLDTLLATPGSREAAALSGISAMLQVRRQHAAFSPYAGQVVHGGHEALVVVERVPADGCRAAVAVNVSGAPVPLELPPGRWVRIDAGADAAGSAAVAGDALGPWENAWFVELP